MEMKNIDKGQRSESTLTMSTTRRSSNDYRSMDDLPPYHEERNEMYYHPPSDHEERERFLPPRQPNPGIIRPKATKPLMISVDAQPPPREPIAMVTALPNGALNMDRGEAGMLSRPGFPRTQYNMQYTSGGGPRVNAGDLPQPPPIQAFPVEYALKPQQSPYKKAGPPLSAVPVKPRAIPVIKPKAPDVVLKAGADPDIQKSESTEELSAEMANLDCLMKDLNAITQQNFEV
ncbi:neogenin-like isoform X6 [Saccostrea cucullata]